MFPSTITSLHPMTSSSPPWSTPTISAEADTIISPKALGSLGPYIRRSIGLLRFNPGPQPVARLGRNPRRCSTSSGCAIFRLRISTHRLAPLWKEHGLSGLRYLPTLTTHLSRIVYSRQSTVSIKTGGCPRLSKLGPLPPSHLPLQRTRAFR